MKTRFNGLIIKLYLPYLKLILYLLGLVALFWLACFVYNNLYTTAIVPQSIDPNEIIAHRQKVNTELFNIISDKISDKQSEKYESLHTIRNPFK